MVTMNGVSRSESNLMYKAALGLGYFCEKAFSSSIFYFHLFELLGLCTK